MPGPRMCLKLPDLALPTDQLAAFHATVRSALQIGVEQPFDLPQVLPEEQPIGELGIAVELNEGIQARIRNVHF